MQRYTYIYEYIPTTMTTATKAQIADRSEVLDFMDGSPSRSLRESIASKAIAIASNDHEGHVIAFFPSWSRERTVLRYGALARHLIENTHIETYLDALSLQHDGDPILRTKDLVCNPLRVRGRKVIMIGSIYTTGHSFTKACDTLMNGGAKSVEGIFVAKIAAENDSQQ